MTSKNNGSKEQKSIYKIRFIPNLNIPENIISVLNNTQYGVSSVSYTKIFNLDEISIVLFSLNYWDEIEKSLYSLLNIQEIKKL